MIRLICTIIVLLNTYALLAQSQIKGIVEDSLKNRIPFCSIGLLNFNDSSIVKGTITNEQGEFSFENLNIGTYLIKIKISEYEEFISDLINTDSNKIKCCLTIQLISKEKNIDGVVIKSFKKTINFEEGKIILNVENDILSQGNNVLEIIRKMPGVLVDAQNNISINGKSGVKFLLDGHLQQIPTTQMLLILSNISAESISRIELIKNPSAKYDASGTGGLINIISKEVKVKGASGSISNSLGQGKGTGEMNNFIFNYKNNKLSIFSNLMISYRDYKNVFNSKRNLNQNSTESIINGIGNEESFVSTFDIKCGIQYDVSRKNFFGINLDNSMVNINSIGHSDFEINDNNNLTNFLVYKDNKSHYFTPNLNMNFTHLLDTLGSQILFSGDIMKYEDSRKLINENITKSNIDYVSYRNSNLLNFNVYSQKIDFVKIISSNLRFESGVKFSYTSNETNSSVQEKLNPVSDYYNLNQFNNQFYYKEQIYSGYVDFIKSVKKWSLKIGLRLEDTKLSAFNKSNEFKLNRSYFNFFPSSTMSYKMNDNNEFQILYSYRLDRPDYEQLNPIYSFKNKLNYAVGNPFLMPQYSHNFDVELNTKGVLTNSISLISMNNGIYNYSYMKDSSRISIDTLYNFKLKQMISYNLFFQNQFTSFYRMQVNAQFACMNYFGQIENNQIKSSIFTFRSTLNNEFLLLKDIKLQLFISYSGPYKDGFQYFSSQSSVNLGLQKKFLKNKLNVTLNFSDIFYKDYNSITTDLSNQSYYSIQKNDTRRVRLNLNYKFGKMNIDNKIHDKKAIENSRILNH